LQSIYGRNPNNVMTMKIGQIAQNHGLMTHMAAPYFFLEVSLKTVSIPSLS